MAKKTIYEVLILSGDGYERAAIFTDDFLARQAIDRLYEALRQMVIAKDPTVASVTEQVAAVGWDTWYPNNRNSSSPLFRSSPATLYNSIPSGLTKFTFVEEQDGLSF